MTKRSFPKRFRFKPKFHPLRDNFDLEYFLFHRTVFDADTRLGFADESSWKVKKSSQFRFFLLRKSLRNLSLWCQKEIRHFFCCCCLALIGLSFKHKVFFLFCPIPYSYWTKCERHIPGWRKILFCSLLIHNSKSNQIEQRKKPVFLKVLWFSRYEFSSLILRFFF